MRQIIGWLAMVMIASACAPVATPLPAPSDTVTPIPTNTVSADEMTAAVAFQRTLPASFTPTFTPTITVTATATPRPSRTPLPTMIPEDALCAGFFVSTLPADAGVNRADLSDYPRLFVEYESVQIRFQVFEADRDDILSEVVLVGDFPHILNLSPENFPEVGEYRWMATLEDTARQGLCEQTGTFETRADEVATPVAVPTANAEVTAEVTGVVEVTAEVTVEAERTRAPLRLPPR